MSDAHRGGLVSPDPMTNAKKLAGLLTTRERLEKDLADAKDDIDELRTALLTAIEEGRFPNGFKEGGRTFFIKRTLWAGVEKGLTKDRVCEALREADLGDYVTETFNTNSLSAYVRDVAREAKTGAIDLSPEEVVQKLPEQLRGRVKVTEKVELGYNSSGSS